MVKPVLIVILLLAAGSILAFAKMCTCTETRFENRIEETNLGFAFELDDQRIDGYYLIRRPKYTVSLSLTNTGVTGDFRYRIKCNGDLSTERTFPGTVHIQAGESIVISKEFEVNHREIVGFDAEVIKLVEAKVPIANEVPCSCGESWFW